MPPVERDQGELARRSDIRRLDDRMDFLGDRMDRLDGRMDRLEARFDRLEDIIREQQRFYVATTVGSMTALTAIFSLAVGLLT